jgi:hypothetical protein
LRPVPAVLRPVPAVLRSVPAGRSGTDAYAVIAAIARSASVSS